MPHGHLFEEYFYSVYCSILVNRKWSGNGYMHFSELAMISYPFILMGFYLCLPLHAPIATYNSLVIEHLASFTTCS